MRVIPGSHKRGLLEHADARDDSNMLFRGETVAAVDESLARDVLLRPGEMSLHHSTLVHGSNPNTSEGPRIGFIVRFVTSRIRGRERPLMRVRGQADCGHLTLAAPPDAADTRAALDAWRESQGL
jgi:ectoine hydroxylase-related dioxygenase (phytanoyl-CoA dioxygenase family)